MLRVLLGNVFLLVVWFIGVYHIRLVSLKSPFVILKFYQMRVGLRLDRECRGKFGSGLISGGAPSDSSAYPLLFFLLRYILWTLQLGLLFWSHFTKLL